MSLFRKKKIEDTPVVETEADRALAKTRIESAQAMAAWPSVEKVSAVLEHELDQNNFAGRIRAAMGGART